MKNNNVIYDEIKYGEETNVVLREVRLKGLQYLFKSYDDILQDIKIANELDERKAFLEGVVRRLEYLGVNCEKTDCKGIIKEINNRYKSRMGKEISRTVKEWIRGTIPGVDQKYRRNLYELCYALEMDVNETADFFIKNFMTIPFNYKDKVDAIFLYCILNNKTYDVIEKMIEKSDEFVPNSSVTTETKEIGRNILEIDDDDEFLRYIEQHCYSNEQQYLVARNRIKELVDDIVEIEKEENIGDNNVVINKIDTNVFGFSYQRNIKKNLKANSEMKKYIQDNKLPKRFVESIPRCGVLADILKGKKETYETLRKTIIILYFYVFFWDLDSWDEDEIKSYASDFYEEINAELFDCGFAPMYVRHPFDCLMMFCAMTPEPLETFRELNQFRYKEL